MRNFRSFSYLLLLLCHTSLFAVTPILTPAFKERKTSTLRLENGLQIYLISDPTADKSAAALSVNVGSWDEPKEYPGLAHFLEHMLFLGTTKYPQEGDYDRFLAGHGGQSNAFTENRATSYMFAINHNAFEEALDRFASFFREPLFSASGVSRERQAVHQEYSKNLEDDNWREMHVYKEIANAKHPYSRFDIGNSSSLETVTPSILRSFFETHYSANLMRLVIYSPLSEKKLQELVTAAFGPIKTINRSPLEVKEPLFDPAFNGKMISITPVKAIRKLTLRFDLPAHFAHELDSKPDTIVGYVLGHEGKESLLAELKRENLAESIQSGGMQLGGDNMAFFLEVSLTEEGLKNYKQVILRCFQAIANFREKGTPQYLFDELQRMALIAYQYPSREDAFHTVTRHVVQLLKEPLKSYPEETLLYKNFNPQLVQELLSNLTPDRCQYALIASSEATNKKEKWFQVPYGIRDISKEDLLAWSAATPISSIDLPAKNRFIPQNLELLVTEGNSDYPTPEAVVQNEGALIYFAQDQRYLIPEIAWSFEWKSPEIDGGSPVKVVLTDLYIKSAKEALNTVAYEAKMAGLEFDIEQTKYNGILVTLNGYSENASKLLDEIVRVFKEMRPSEEAFAIYKETLLRDYQNAAKEMPVKQAVELMNSLLYKDYVLPSQKIKALRRLSYERFLDYVTAVFQQTFVEGMLYGNMTKEEASNLFKMTATPYLKSRQKKQEFLLLPEQKGPFYLTAHTPSQGQAALLALQLDPFSFKQRAAQQILGQSIQQPFYDTLRTKQQTGYIAFSWNEENALKLYNFFAVQSNTHEARDLLARFEELIERYLQELPRELTEERFHAIQSALITNMEQSTKNMKEMGLQLRTFGFRYEGDFNWMKKRMQGARELTYEELLKVAHHFFGRINKRRLSILMEGELPKETSLQYKRLPSGQAFRKEGQYNK